MGELLAGSPVLCTALTLICYFLADALQRKLRLALLNPLLLSSGAVIAVLVYLGVDYPAYYANTGFLSVLLTPVTVALAIPLYERIELLRRNFVPILVGVICGSVLCMGTILIMSMLFDLSHEIYVTILPKSITTAMSTSMSELWDGVVPITVVAVCITGIFGNVTGEYIFRLFRITDPMSRGIALGSGSHAIGTAKATELGETEGAMGGLAIVLMGLATVILGNLFIHLY